jgi:hypothetical protein
MRADTRFVDILDAHLGERPGPTPVTTTAAASRPAEVYHLPFLHTWNGPAAAGVPKRAISADPRPAPPARETTRAETTPRKPRRVPHRLTPAQQTALRELLACGAELHDDFTADDLRRTFRSLAQRYHPDRHPGAADDEHRRLATTFARVNEGYRVLLKKVS